MNKNTGTAESVNNKGFTSSASSAFALVQVVQKSSANMVQIGGKDFAPKIAPVSTSILDVKISIFASYQSTEPKEVNLLKWLTSDKYADKVMTIRQTSDKPERDKLKADLPAITPSGLFSKREAAGLKHHSGFIQIDVDNVPDIAATKGKIISIENVAYCGLSVSGRGLWGLIPIASPEHHREYFTFIEKVFAELGITIDAACKDVCRLRGYSYDKDAYFNHSALPLQKWFEPKKQRVTISHFQPIYGNGNIDKVNTCIEQIQAQGIDLTGNYDTWFKLGCSLANEFGEGGRNLYHSISQFHPKYNPADTDKQFNHCLRHRYSTTIATFFAACKDAGVMFRTISAVPAKSDRVQIGFTVPNVPPKPDRLRQLVAQGNEDAALYSSGAIDRQGWFKRSDTLQAAILSAGFSLKEYVHTVNSLN